MKKILLIPPVLLFISLSAVSQSAKEKAGSPAKDEFSKTKYKKKEKYGVVTEVKRLVESSPVIKDNLSFYNGNYVYQGLGYKIVVFVVAAITAIIIAFATVGFQAIKAAASNPVKSLRTE